MMEDYNVRMNMGSYSVNISSDSGDYEGVYEVQKPQGVYQGGGSGGGGGGGMISAPTLHILP